MTTWYIPEFVITEGCVGILALLMYRGATMDGLWWYVSMRIATFLQWRLGDGVLGNASGAHRSKRLLLMGPSRHHATPNTFHTYQAAHTLRFSTPSPLSRARARTFRSDDELLAALGSVLPCAAVPQVAC